MAVRDIQLFDDSVKTRTIAADVVVPADIDETAAYNYSSASGTFAGIPSRIKAGIVNDLGTSSTARGFPTAFAAAPKMVVTLTENTSTATVNMVLTGVSASSFNLYASAAGTAHWMAANL